MSLLQATLLGIIEGITEFLPISSTAHLILAGKLFGIPSSEFTKSFDIAIQLGAILAVVALYAGRLLQTPRVILTVVVAFLPTAIIGALFYEVVKNVFFESTDLILWTMGLGGIALIAFEAWHPKSPRTDDLAAITVGQAVWIGIAQAVAIVPGVSRAAATIVGGMLLGVSRTAIVEFSFLLAIPTMAAATGLDLMTSGTPFTTQEWTVLAVGFAVAFVTAMLAVTWFVHFLQRHTFTPFGVYRIAAAILFVILLRGV